MKPKIVTTNDIRKLMTAIDNLLNRPQHTEGMGLLWGEPGTGKTQAIAKVAVTYKAIYLTAKNSWTPSSMLGDLCKALGGKRKQKRADMVDFIVEKLTCGGQPLRPIIIDEADYCFKRFDMVDDLRDIYDVSKCPVILAGMENIAREIREHGRIARRITQWVEFRGFDLEDTTKMINEVCDVAVEEDLIRYIHQQTLGNAGRIRNAILMIEQYAEPSGITRFGMKHLDGRPLYFDQPDFTKRRAELAVTARDILKGPKNGEKER